MYSVQTMTRPQETAISPGPWHSMATWGRTGFRRRGALAGVRSGSTSTWEVDFVWHLDDGRLIKMTEVAPGAPPWDYVGEILDPPGRR